VTELLIRETLRPLTERCIAGAVAGEYQFAVVVDEGETRGIGVLFVPLDQIAAVRAFVTAQCGGRGPSSVTHIPPIDPEGN
jgi:hypothetical protein